jgi:hypothetical protein
MKLVTVSDDQVVLVSYGPQVVFTAQWSHRYPCVVGISSHILVTRYIYMMEHDIGKTVSSDYRSNIRLSITKEHSYILT